MYDQEALADAVSKYPAPEFIPEPGCPFYHLPAGKNSQYGDQVYVLLKSMVMSKGFDADTFRDGLVAMYGPGSAYDFEHGERPIQGPWLTHHMKKFLANIAAGSDDAGNTGSNDCDGPANVAVVVALYAGDPQLTAKAEEMVKTLQNTPICIKYTLAAAKLLEGLILNGPNASAVEDLKGVVDGDVAEALAQVLGMRDTPHSAAVKALGLPCPLPGSFMSAMHCLLNAPAGKFTEGFRPTLLAGGDNCARATLLGACLGAQLGLEGLPADLLSKVERGSEVVELAEQLVAMRP